MRKFVTALIVTLFAGAGIVSAQMTDDQILEYISAGVAAGKTQQQIGRELLAQGVRLSQIQQVKNRMQNEMKEGTLTYKPSGTTVGSNAQSRMRQSEQTTEPASARNQQNIREAYDQYGPFGAPDYQTTQIFQNGGYAGVYYDPVSGMPIYGEPYFPILDSTALANYKPIYGHQIFRSPALSFEPNENLATPADYKLGPGDEVIIDVWGASENTIRETISPEGDIMVSHIGPVYLAGLTIKEASDKIRNSFAQNYEGVSGDEPSSDIRVSLGSMRTIRVNVMGEVATPGTYRLSGFSSLFHALYNAGGITSIGSLREIKIMRGGRQIAVADIYEYLFDGKQSVDIRLQEDDVIVVPAYSALVRVEGEMKRPMYYEFKAGETLDDLVKYSGGFTGNGYTGELQIIRGTGREHTMRTVLAEDFGTVELADGDIVTAGAILDRFDNRVEISGAVFREGMYELNDRISTVRRLVAAADGVRDDAFLSRALLTRKKDDFSFEMIALDLGGILKGTAADVALMPDDVLFIPSSYDITERGDFTISGMVANPGDYIYVENTTIEDLILQAGGLLDGASTVQIEVARRSKDPKSRNDTSVLGEIFVFDMKDGYMVDGGENFILEPYDVVQVRRSPAYQPQRNVSIEGEVVFAGDYSLMHKAERLSDLVKRAGGVTADAYAHGARLIRQMTEDEIAMSETVRKMTSRDMGRDSVSIEMLDVARTYSVGIELDKALENPGSDFDMVLREGDRLIIPEKVSTVRIDGTVMYPNTVLYQSGKKLKYYISQAGGYGYRAKRNSVYVIYMNGTVARVNRGKGKTMLEPGCEIIVPSKPEHNGLRLAEILSVSTTAASLGTMAASIANIVK